MKRLCVLKSDYFLGFHLGFDDVGHPAYDPIFDFIGQVEILQTGAAYD